VAAAAMLAVAPAAAKTIKVGVILRYAGVNADLGQQIDRAFDLYVKLHAKDLAPYKIKLIKRHEGLPDGSKARTDITGLVTRDKVKLLTGFVFSPSVIAAAPLISQAKIPNAGRQCGYRLDHQSLALDRALFLQYVGPRLSNGDLRGREAALQDGGLRLHRFSPPAGQRQGLQDGLHQGRWQGDR